MEPVLNEAAKDSGRPGNKAIVRGEGFCLHRAMNKFRPLLAEFIGTFALIFVGIGAIKTAGSDTLAVAMAHGLTIAAFVSATLHISGGNLNPAVTFGLVCGGHMKIADAISYWIAQLLGGICAARSEEHTSELQSRFDLVC